MFGDEIFINPSVLNHHVQNAVGQRAVAPGADGQEEVGRARDGCDARIDDDDFRAVIARAPNIIRQNRKTLGDIRARENEHLGLRDVLPRIGAAVDAERHLVCRARADHAKAAIVIDVLRAERDAGKLTVEVRLLIRH